MAQGKEAAPIRVALVGVGRMGKNYLRIIRDSRNFELAAVVDREAPQPADLGAAAFGRSVAELRDEDFDAAVVATPTASHFEISRELVARGKHLLVEKPITATFREGRELIELSLARGVKLAVGHVERFNPAVRKLREVMREGWLGTAIHFSFTRVGGRPGAIACENSRILDLAVHDIDILRSLVGSLRVASSVCHATVKDGVYDTAEIFLRGASGVSATVHVNWITPTKIRTLRVTGTRGVVFVDYMLQTCELVGGDRVSFDVVKEEPLRAQLDQFHRLLTSSEAGELCLGKDALSAVLLVERALAAERDRFEPRKPSPGNALPSADDVWV